MVFCLTALCFKVTLISTIEIYIDVDLNE